MKRERTNKSNRGRKPNRAVLSGIPEEETWDEIRCRMIYGSNEWPIVAVRHLIATNQRQKIAPFMRKLLADCERAALNGDWDWFARQAKAIEKGGRAGKRARFYELVIRLFDIAVCATQGRAENWRPLSNAEREAYPNLRRVPLRVPHVVTLTPAGKFTDAMASHIWKAVVDVALKEPETRSVIEQQLAAAESYGLTKGWRNKKRQTIEQIVAEIYGFKTKEGAMDAIHDLATRLQVELKKQRRKT